MAFTELETLVERIGLRNTVYALAGVCNDKAIKNETGCDYNAARIWERDSQALKAAAKSLHSIPEERA
jgi:hypothetical protein